MVIEAIEKSQKGQGLYRFILNKSFGKKPIDMILYHLVYLYDKSQFQLLTFTMIMICRCFK